MWHDQNHSRLLDIPNHIRQELFTTPSLTKRISEKGVFSIKVLCQTQQKQFFDEKLLLQNFSAFANVRTVLLLCDSTPIVFARTVLPMKSIKRTLQQLTKLGNKSLGAVLHSSNKIKINQMKIATINQNYPLYDLLPKAIKTYQSNENLWARCSIYQNNNSKLLVSEVFLENYWRVF